MKRVIRANEDAEMAVQAAANLAALYTKAARQVGQLQDENAQLRWERDDARKDIVLLINEVRALKGLPPYEP